MAGYVGRPDIESFNSIAIKSFRTDDKMDIKGKLVRSHYTSANALLSILRPDNKGDTYLRFTDIHYMNDKSEKLYFIRQLLRFIAANRGKYPFCEEVVNQLLLKANSADEYIDLKVSGIKYTEEFEKLFQATRNFVFCTSEAKDSLQMWNYYVHNGAYQGYNIGFDIYKFVKSFDSDDPKLLDPISIHYGKVLYKEKEQFAEIDALLGHIEKMWGNQTDMSFYGAVDLRRYIDSKGVFFKNDAFASEREYRIVIEIAESRLLTDKSAYFNKNQQKISLDFCERAGIVVPFLKVPFPKESVQYVTMSPIMEYGIAQKSVEEFLRVYQYNDVAVRQSEIPIRF